jgi:hypothetical protein
MGPEGDDEDTRRARRVKSSNNNILMRRNDFGQGRYASLNMRLAVMLGRLSQARPPFPSCRDIPDPGPELVP